MYHIVVISTFPSAPAYECDITSVPRLEDVRPWVSAMLSEIECWSDLASSGIQNFDDYTQFHYKDNSFDNPCIEVRCISPDGTICVLSDLVRSTIDELLALNDAGSEAESNSSALDGLPF